MPHFTRFLIASCFLLFLSVSSRSATIKGLISDAKTGEPLVGAVVALDNTQYSVLTGLDGSYQLTNIPAGQYKLVVLFASYEKHESDITLTQDQEMKANVSLSSKSRMLHEVEIKSHYKNGSENQARSLEKNSDEIKNIMSAHTIELLPDITVANVLQRVSGVQVQRDAKGEARYTVIRGMDKRYNYTTVDGVKIPSPDDKGRFVPMDIFPSEIVERLEVIKSLTPNMEADAIGGGVNLVLKNAPDKFTINASAATGYNQNNFDHSYTSFSRKGIDFNDPYQKNGIDYAATPTDFQTSTLHYKNASAKPNALLSLSIGNRFLKNKKLGVIFSGSYQNTYKSSSSIFFLPSVQPGVVGTTGNVPAITDLELYKYSTQTTRSALHGKVDYNFNDKNNLSLYALYLQTDELEYRNIIDTTVQINRIGAGSGPVDLYDRSAFRRKSIANLTLHGEHTLINPLSLNYSLAYTKANGKVPDMTQLHLSQEYTVNTQTNEIVWKPVIFNSISHSWENTNDKDLSAYVNLVYKPEIFNRTVDIEAGGMYRNKNRDNYYNAYSLKPTNAQQPFTTVDDASVAVQNVHGMEPYNDLSYTVTENVSAEYLQAKAMILKKLQLLAGVRMEHTYLKYTIQMDPSNFTGQNGTFNYSDLLPGIHFKYGLNDKTNLRLSYYGSITRPSFFELVPYTFIGENLTEIGNYYLSHSTAKNFDFRYEYFPKGLDELLVGAFYKKIDNAIEYAFIHIGSGASQGALQPQNLDKPVTNFGVEVQAVKYFHSFGISANYTYTNSSVESEKKSRIRKPDNTGDTVLYVTQKRPLQGQAAHIANLSLIYKNPKLGMDAHLTWVYTGRHIAFISNYIDLDYWQKGTSFFDLSLEKRVAKHFSVYAKVNNLFNTSVVIELPYPKDQFVSKDQTYQLPYQTLSKNLLVKQDSYGRNYLIGVRYKID